MGLHLQHGRSFPLEQVLEVISMVRHVRGRSCKKSVGSIVQARGACQDAVWQGFIMSNQFASRQPT